MRVNRNQKSPHRMAVTVYDGILGFEFGIATEVLGLVRPGMENDWYDFRHCRVERGTLKSSHGHTVTPASSREFIVNANTVVIPGWRDPTECLKPAFLEMIREAHANGARIVAICTGAFVLGYAGLLDGRKCTTHWIHTELFQQKFPEANLKSHSLYVQDDMILTSAGSAAGLDLCLHVIRLDFGHEVAAMVAKRMVAPAHREGGQSQYAQPIVLETDDDEFGPVLDWLERHLDHDLTVRQVSARFNMSLRTYQRKFQQLTGMAFSKWLNRQRVELARKLLETTEKSIDQVAFESGLGSASNLRKHFARSFRTSPSRYRSDLRDSAPSARSSGGRPVG